MEWKKFHCIVVVLRNTTHNGFPVVDDGVVSPTGLELLRAHILELIRRIFYTFPLHEGKSIMCHLHHSVKISKRKSQLMVKFRIDT